MKTQFFCLIAFCLYCLLFSPEKVHAAQVSFYQEGFYTENQAQVKIYADIDASDHDPLITAGITLSYDPSQLRLLSAEKNEDIWYLGTSSNFFNYINPIVSDLGEINFMVAKLDQDQPLAGVTGSRVLIGTAGFKNINTGTPIINLSIGNTPIKITTVNGFDLNSSIKTIPYELDHLDALYNTGFVAGIIPFNAQFTSISNGDPTSYLWFFDDGHTSNEQNPIHIYQEAGQYSVSLTITRDGISTTEIKDNLIKVFESSQDSDQDGLADHIELNSCTDENNPDSDDDGLKDGQEDKNKNGSPDPNETDLCLADTDNDGLNDGEEIAIGSDPLDPFSTTPIGTIYEDGEDLAITGWDIYDNDPAGANIVNVYDEFKQSNVLELSGSFTNNGYWLRDDEKQNWDNSEEFIVEWSMRYQENYVVYISVDTVHGHRYIYYTASETNRLDASEGYIHHGLGRESKDGQWHVYARDLKTDLADAEPANEILEVNGFLIRGSGRIDDISLLYHYPENIDTDNDGIINLMEINTFKTNALKADSDMDGINDGDELNYWGDKWELDIDNDGVLPLVDYDSDNDGQRDGFEIQNQSDPGDATDTAFISPTIYEDGEDLTTIGWDIYDNDSAKASIVNVYDKQKQSNVIEFSGASITNGYRLRGLDNNSWDNADQSIIQWSMRYKKNYAIYVSVDTLYGHRYLYYNSANKNNSGNNAGYVQQELEVRSRYNNGHRQIISNDLAVDLIEEENFLSHGYNSVQQNNSGYIHHGLGDKSRNGKWQTINRDLAADLATAEPENEIIDVNAFLIHGSGRIDDIILLNQ